MEHEPATQGQVLEVIARIATQTPWKQVDSAFLQREYIGLSPSAFTEKILQVFSPHGSEMQVVSSIIHVDRTVRPTYPSWMKKVLYPKLENTGPEEFDVTKLELWLHNDQKAGTVKGNVIHDHLKSNNMLEGCLGLRDLEEIQKKGVTFFRENFKGKAVFAWKSVVRHADGYLLVPYLIENDGKVVLYWNWLDNDWNSSNPALRFATLFISKLLRFDEGVLFYGAVFYDMVRCHLYDKTNFYDEADTRARGGDTSWGGV